MKSITITYTPDAALIRAASLSWRQKSPWWFSVGRGVLFGVAAILVIRFGFRFDPETSHFAAFFLGAVTVMVLWQISHMRHMKQVVDAALNSDPSTTATFDATGVRLQTENSDGHVQWPAVTSIAAIPGGTGLRVSGSVLGIPDSAIMDQMTPTVFRDRLTKWQEATS